jgi:hypothetical protein
MKLNITMVTHKMDETAKHMLGYELDSTGSA